MHFNYSWHCAADRENEKEVAEAKLNEVLLEKEQASSDLSAMERSFSELFKRLEKYKEVIEGYKKVRNNQCVPVINHKYLMARKSCGMFDFLNCFLCSLPE